MRARGPPPARLPAAAQGPGRSGSRGCRPRPPGSRRPVRSWASWRAGGGRGVGTARSLRLPLPPPPFPLLPQRPSCPHQAASSLSCLDTAGPAATSGHGPLLAQPPPPPPALPLPPPSRTGPQTGSQRPSLRTRGLGAAGGGAGGEGRRGRAAGPAWGPPGWPWARLGVRHLTVGSLAATVISGHGPRLVLGAGPQAVAMSARSRGADGQGRGGSWGHLSSSPSSSSSPGRAQEKRHPQPEGGCEPDVTLTRAARRVVRNTRAHTAASFRVSV